MINDGFFDSNDLNEVMKVLNKNMNNEWGVDYNV